jgi:hypothetical protein
MRSGFAATIEGFAPLREHALQESFVIAAATELDDALRIRCRATGRPERGIGIEEIVGSDVCPSPTRSGEVLIDIREDALKQFVASAAACRALLAWKTRRRHDMTELPGQNQEAHLGMHFQNPPLAGEISAEQRVHLLDLGQDRERLLAHDRMVARRSERSPTRENERSSLLEREREELSIRSGKHAHPSAAELPPRLAVAGA